MSCSFSLRARFPDRRTRHCGIDTTVRGDQLVARASTEALSGRLPGLPASRVDVPRRQGEAGVPPRRRTAMGDHVYKSPELTGSSTDSIEHAVRTATPPASNTPRHIPCLEVLDPPRPANDGKVPHWQLPGPGPLPVATQAEPP